MGNEHKHYNNLCNHCIEDNNGLWSAKTIIDILFQVKTINCANCGAINIFKGEE